MTKKNNRRWMPISERLFALNTSGMSAEEVGAFCLIWSWLSHQPGGRSQFVDEKSLATVSRVSLYRWRKMAPHVLRMFVVDENGIGLKRKNYYRSSIPMATKKFVFGRDGNRCRYCGTTEGDFHIDHIVPVIVGGTNDPANLCVACAPCNHSKHATPLEVWKN